MKTLKTLIVGAVAAAMLTGCSLGSSSASLNNITPVDPNTSNNPVDPNEPVAIEPVDPTPPPRCDMGKSYTGFAGTMLEAGRVDLDLGVERQRMKPYSALQGEYTRVLGNTPGLLATSGSTFAIEPARWLTEPQGSAVNLYQAYRIAFQGCLTATATATAYGSMPSNTTADTECRTWARKFWSRTPTQMEVDSCVQVAMVDTSSETNVRRRWAYTCASVLSATGFMTY
jgi:hypothetical protein